MMAVKGESMTRRSTRGTKQLAAELLAEVVDDFKKFCRDRDETVRYHLEMALRRHMANPPPPQVPILPPAPPLPPVTAPASGDKPAAKKPKGKGKK
jgi:hypothetical protein